MIKLNSFDIIPDKFKLTFILPYKYLNLTIYSIMQIVDNLIFLFAN